MGIYKEPSLFHSYLISKYITFWKMQNYRDIKLSNGFQGWIDKAHGVVFFFFFREVKLFYSYYSYYNSGFVTHKLVKIHRNLQHRVNLNVSKLKTKSFRRSENPRRECIMWQDNLTTLQTCETISLKVGRGDGSDLSNFGNE